MDDATQPTAHVGYTERLGYKALAMITSANEARLGFDIANCSHRKSDN